MAGAAGMTIIVALVGRAIDSGLTMDALWAKNLTYFFGHSVFNLTIYLSVGAVYVMLPGYTGRPWKTTKPIVVAWLFTLLFVTTAYGHHLYMDFVQPEWVAGFASIASFGAALPVAVVTIFTGVVLIWGSRYRWTLASALLYLGFMGWAIGGTGAVIDSLIPINFKFHNTLWVTAHFHTYLLMAVILWAFALFVRMLEESAGRTARDGVSAFSLGALLVGGYGLVGVWFVSGTLGIPRRWAIHPEGTAGYSLVASVFAIVFAVGFMAGGHPADPSVADRRLRVRKIEPRTMQRAAARRSRARRGSSSPGRRRGSRRARSGTRAPRRRRRTPRRAGTSSTARGCESRRGRARAPTRACARSRRASTSA